ncbi:hypothetical protein GCM10009557_53460 [Virgisporangium ochraceum]|uniref:DUF7919 domain-containing protein n=1 Tax=Virgisporangium ochraceum TaxID=65505 RepID=A0A8J3ZTN5_9ACTN|nr:hypothetical protein [Virgisporangium ochraceum]GIJ68797.1 hypothetical protein Voc01_037140 [Virgisporangium ochraceum]
MTYFEDLTEYTYCEREVISIDGGYVEYRSGHRRLNVGWMDAPHPVPTGDVPGWLPARLLDLIDGPLVNVMRGFHLCTHCGDFDRAMLTVPHGSGTVSMGHAELRVPGEGTTMYAAPTLIWHYVTGHGYRPPEPFIDALQTYDDSWIPRT